MSILTKNVDNIIYADLTDGDNDLYEAYDALYAYSSGQTTGTFQDYITTANNIGNHIVTALNLGDFESVRFSEFATRELANQGLLQTRDVDNIIKADLVNGDNDLFTAYSALEAFSLGQTQDSTFEQTIYAANNIGNHIVTALNQGDFESVRFAEYATRELGNQGLLQTRDVDNIIKADLVNGDNDLFTAYSALEAFSFGQTQDSTFEQTIYAANNIGNHIVTALNQGDFESVRFAEFATRELGNQGLLETLDIDDIVFRDVVNGDDDLFTAYAAIEAFVSGGSQGGTPADFDAVAESIVDSAEIAQNTLGQTGEMFADYVANVLDGYTDTSGLV